ncbi:MAG: hypothetical protein J0I97_01780, partial [Microbacterium sp.]|nr:hypothetical protein [Microbacterium sp.]
MHREAARFALAGTGGRPPLPSGMSVTGSTLASSDSPGASGGTLGMRHPSTSGSKANSGSAIPAPDVVRTGANWVTCTVAASAESG